MVYAKATPEAMRALISSALAAKALTRLADRPAFGCFLGCDSGCEAGKELVGQLLRSSRDQTIAQLGDLAADVGAGVVGQQAFRPAVFKRDNRATLGKARNAIRAFALQAETVRRRIDQASPCCQGAP